MSSVSSAPTERPPWGAGLAASLTLETPTDTLTSLSKHPSGNTTLLPDLSLAVTVAALPPPGRSRVTARAAESPNVSISPTGIQVTTPFESCDLRPTRREGSFGRMPSDGSMKPSELSTLILTLAVSPVHPEGTMKLIRSRDASHMAEKPPRGNGSALGEDSMFCPGGRSKPGRRITTDENGLRSAVMRKSSLIVLASPACAEGNLRDACVMMGSGSGVGAVGAGVVVGAGVGYGL
mmetsp:Transcript_37586/g.96040  ORF Transcript_37586/g.96040 Transcript_37586/m.96040 type:complete len:236 (-) Transcript_37586:11-718(-)